MLNAATIKIGEKVHYKTHPGDIAQNGMVKEVPEWTTKQIRVVFHCAGEWDNYKDYTSQLTPVKYLYLGWVHEEVEENEYL